MMNAIVHRSFLRRLLLFGVITVAAGICGLIGPHSVSAQAVPQPDPSRCYAVANVPQDRLYQIDPASGVPSNVQLVQVGPGVNMPRDPDDPEGLRMKPQSSIPTDIEAIVFAPARSGPGMELYAFSQRNFGVFDLATGMFTPIGGGIPSLIDDEFVNIDGLAYDWESDRMFGAVRRRAGPQPDLLIEIDRSTGTVVPSAFGPGVDYVTMEVDGRTDLDDLAFDPTTGILYGTMNEKGQGRTAPEGVILVTIDSTDGDILTAIDILNGNNRPVYDLEGLTFDAAGTLFATSGANYGPLNRFYRLDKLSGQAEEVSHVAGMDGALQDTEAIACPPLLPEPGIQLVKYCQNEDANQPPGPGVLLGEDVTWIYVVENTGNVPLSNVTLVDDPLGTIDCPQDTLDPGEMMSCTFTRTATEPGQESNIGRVTAQWVDRVLSDEDPSHCYVAAPAIELVKYCEGIDANDPDGPDVPVVPEDATLTWTYVMTNTGDVALTDVTLTDDPLGPVTCPQDSLAVGEVMTCTQTGDTSGADENGLIGNLGTVIGCAAGFGLPCSDSRARVTDADPSHCRVEVSPDPAIEVQSVMTFTWSYFINNIGGTDLSDVVLDPGEDIIVDPPLIPSLPAGVEAEVSVLVPGQPLDRYSVLYTNLVTATGTLPGDEVVSATCAPQPFLFPDYLEAQVVLSGVDAPDLSPGDPLTWTYTISNTAPLTITDLDVQQIAGTVGSSFVVAACDDTQLAPGQVTTCVATDTASAGTVTTFSTVAGRVAIDTTCEPARSAVPVVTNLQTTYAQADALVRVGGRVFQDISTRQEPANGIQDPLEQGVAGVLVRVTEVDGAATADAVTDQAGTYAISVPPGTYALTFEVPSDHPLAGAPWTVANRGANDRLDSDVVPTPATGSDGVAAAEVALTLSTGGANHGVDAGLVVAYESLLDYLFLPLISR